MDQLIRQRLNEIRQKQLAAHKNTRTTDPATLANNPSPYLFALAGLAAGIIIAFMVWLVMTSTPTDDARIVVPDSHATIDAAGIRTANDAIEQLTWRIDRLAGAVSRLEESVSRETTTPDASMTSGHQSAPTRHSEAADADAAPAISGDLDPAVSATGTGTSATARVFVPTHRVVTRVNLRATPSTAMPPLATLDAGTRVQYLREKGDWYYVNTEAYGEGWCASGYLSSE